MRAAPAELRRFLAAFDPAVGRLFLATRAAVLGAAPQAHELIYDAYNAVTAAYSFSERGTGEGQGEGSSAEVRHALSSRGQ